MRGEPHPAVLAWMAAQPRTLEGSARSRSTRSKTWRIRTGIVMLRRLSREQLKRVEQGLDPINTMRAQSANKRISDRRLEHDPVAGRSRRPALQRRPLKACPLSSARAGEDRSGVTPSMAVDSDACIAYNAGIRGKNRNGNADYPQC